MPFCSVRSTPFSWGLLFLSQLLPTAVPSSQTTRFLREEIRIFIMGESCAVAGVYHFRNESPDTVAHRILYPFYLGTDQPEPTSVSAELLPTHASLVPQRIPGASLFWISILPFGESTVAVRYIQPTPSRRMTYILRSTLAWGRPLQEAEFTFVLPNRFRPLFFSIHPDTSWTEREGVCYRIRRRNFTPANDLTIQWKDRP